MMASFCGVNLKGMSGLLSAVLRCYPRWNICQWPTLEVSIALIPLHGGHQLTTMRVSLCFLAESENARVAGAIGRAARLTDRTAVRMRKGASLLAMAAAVSGNGSSVNRLRRRNCWPD